MDGAQPGAVCDLSSLFELLARVERDLKECEARWALVGGVAVGARTEPRFTRDLDIVLAVKDDAAAERVVLSLREKGYEISAVLEHAKTGRLATVRLLPPGDGRLVGLLFASSGIEKDVVEGADVFEVAPAFAAPVASVGHLIAMKILSRDDQRRPQDKLDLAALMKVATKAELESAHEAVKKIVSQGCHRGRSLPSELAEAISEFSTD